MGGENVRGEQNLCGYWSRLRRTGAGWHHCPAGMGIYQTCRIEARNPMHVNDLFSASAARREPGRGVGGNK
ncbi:MAG: hypothetical protein ACLR8Y_08965 [Alistipes indistinctus]